jgi:ATP-dependent DNA helicase 2 subunit 2
MALSETSCIIGQRGNERSQIALSSLIHALDDNDFLALARLVTKDGRPPVLIMMAPSFDTGIECLVDVQVISTISSLILDTIRRRCQTLYFCSSG